MHSTDCRDSRSPRCWRCGDLSHPLLSPPPSLGVTSQLCHSNASWPNSALGRGGIRNPVPRCIELANQCLRPGSPKVFCFFKFNTLFSLFVMKQFTHGQSTDSELLRKGMFYEHQQSLDIIFRLSYKRC